jgi:hypothetical protein
MGKGIRKPPKQEKDFRKQRLKVGRTVSKARNETTVNVRVAKLALPEAYRSSVAADGQRRSQASLAVRSREACRKPSPLRSYAHSKADKLDQLDS